MFRKIKLKAFPLTMLAASVMAATSFSATAAENNDVDQLNKQVDSLRAQMAELQRKLDSVSSKQEARDETAAAAKKESKNGVHVGGAVRFQYSYEDYRSGSNTDRGGDLDLDTVRINFDGRYNDIIMSAEYRHYDYMDVIHHAWVGYEFTEQQNVKLGVVKVPFGILPFASHNFFFSANYYVGLEDDYDAGLAYHYEDDLFDVDAAFFKNDEKGSGSTSTDRYSYDVMGIHTTSGTGAAPDVTLTEGNTWNGRFAYHPTIGDLNLEVGISGQYGELETTDDDSGGDHHAWALHAVADWHNWDIQLQYADYSYNVDNYDVDQMVVGAYAYYDEIPADAKIYTANVAYKMPVKLGPISQLTFYNDYSRVADKSGDVGDSFINVTGMMITSGPIYTYVDYIVAQDQPFIGGSYGSGHGPTNQRLNINVGYYF